MFCRKTEGYFRRIRRRKIVDLSIQGRQASRGRSRYPRVAGIKGQI